jgi:hypothetical protein
LPPRRDLHGGFFLVAGIPDDRVEVFIFRTRGLIKIGLELLWPELEAAIERLT